MRTSSAGRDLILGHRFLGLAGNGSVSVIALGPLVALVRGRAKQLRLVEKFGGYEAQVQVLDVLLSDRQEQREGTRHAPADDHCSCAIHSQ